jgi:PEGA domain
VDIALVETPRRLDDYQPLKVQHVLACSLRHGRGVHLSLTAAVLVAALSSETPCSAQEAPASTEQAEPPGYRAAVESAIGEYEAGRFAEARSLFERANAMFPNARALRGMGMAEFELRNYAASIYFLEQSLASPVKPLTPELRGETETLLGRARGFVGRVRLTVEPPDATVSLNGTVVQLGPDRILTLIVGDYTMQVSAPGFGNEQRALRIAGGEEQAVSVQLPKTVDVLGPVQPPAASEPADQGGGSLLASPWFWTAIGVAVAGAAVGVGVAVAGGDAGQAKPSGGSSGIVIEGP